LKALAIVARTYESTMKGDGTGKAPAAFVPNELTYGEMLSEWGDYYPAYYEAVSEAVLATDGITMNVQEGRMLPYFCVLSAGYTRAMADSCLIMTGCEQDLQSSDYLSIVTYSKSDVSGKIKSKYSDIKFKGEISESIQVISRDEAGYVSEIMVGNLTLSGDEFANLMELKSSNFMITSGEDNMIFTVKGIGCGYGMSLYTARQKANAGAGYEEILYYFYKNIELKSE
jgi:stage II sporulation protein D